MELPAGLVPLGESPEFDVHNVPPALLTEHRTASDCWGRLVVTRGSVDYHDLATGATTRVHAGEQFVIPPAQPHRVALSDDATFRVEFFRQR
ncbi:MAG TPA: DUF1971 domain-containing protein [Planctomycetota bacterium]|nr:DUF1971 domain-containing protein [Planctomycetota bacterium]